MRTIARQHTTPLFIDRLEQSGTVRALDKVSFDSRAHDEAWLQKLIYRFPQLLPVTEIEPAFGSLVSVCRELPTPVGRIDNLYITENGNLAIAECKLWKNPQARREVVAQVIDYAHSMTKWSYEDLESATRAGVRLDDEAVRGGLFSLVSDESDMDERDFVDALSRNLRLGRVLLLLVGDGIREGVETLAEYLQLHAGFHFALGIVEMSVFSFPPHGYLVQPRILARTVNIERGIVKLADSRISIEPIPVSESARVGGISEEQLRERLAHSAPAAYAALGRFEHEAEKLGVVVEAAQRSLQVRWIGPDDVAYALGGIRPDGELTTMTINYSPDRIGKVELAHEYLSRIAALMNKNVRRAEHPKGWRVVGDNNKRPPAIDLLSRSNEWLEIIRWYTKELSSAIEAESTA
jgi:hypothetical protein